MQPFPHRLGTKHAYIHDTDKECSEPQLRIDSTGTKTFLLLIDLGISHASSDTLSNKKTGSCNMSVAQIVGNNMQGGIKPGGNASLLEAYAIAYVEAAMSSASRGAACGATFAACIVTKLIVGSAAICIAAGRNFVTTVKAVSQVLAAQVALVQRIRCEQEPLKLSFLASCIWICLCSEHPPRQTTCRYAVTTAFSKGAPLSALQVRYVQIGAISY